MNIKWRHVGSYAITTLAATAVVARLIQENKSYQADIKKVSEGLRRMNILGIIADVMAPRPEKK